MNINMDKLTKQKKLKPLALIEPKTFIRVPTIN